MASRVSVVATVPSQPLPEAVLRRRVAGFATPIGRWFTQAAGDQPAGEGTYGYSRRWAERVARQAVETAQTPAPQPQMAFA